MQNANLKQLKLWRRTSLLFAGIIIVLLIASIKTRTENTLCQSQVAAQIALTKQLEKNNTKSVTYGQSGDNVNLPKSW